ncbi:MAG: PQQ-dependent sugar dehydrogenase, partial [Candidatus Krumholzibacteriia bacterium]
YDEIDRVPPGFNGGWEPIMGPDARDPQGVADLWMAPGATYVDPVFSWLVSMGVTSLYFVRTDALGTHYRYDCLVADSNNQNLYHFEVSADRVGLVMPDASVADLVADTSAERDLFLLGAGWGTITDIDTGPDGALYVASKSLQTVFRITRKRTSDAGQPRGPGRTRVEAGPNPFRSSTLLRLMGPAVEAPRSLRIYSPRGRLVRVLHATRGSVPWDGADERGAPVAAGVYLVRLHRPAHPRVETKVVRLR